MYKLIAVFGVKLSAYFLINRPEEDTLNYKTRFEEFDVEIQMLELVTVRNYPGEEQWSIGVPMVQVAVARDEIHELPVDTSLVEDNTFPRHVQYFDERLDAYRTVAAEVLNRTIRFFKYTLHNPLLHEFSPNDQQLQNPQWYDEDGNEVGQGTEWYVVTGIPGLGRYTFGANQLTRDDDAKFQAAIETPIEPKLYEELLSDAQAAVFQGNFRRAILEMAIACEVAIKQVYLMNSTQNADGYELPSEEQIAEEAVINLIHKVAERTFGQSFKSVYKQHYINIDHLFRCRNKVAHRGELIYRDDQGIVHEVDRNTIASWWTSVEVLISWLSTLIETE